MPEHAETHCSGAHFWRQSCPGAQPCVFAGILFAGTSFAGILATRHVRWCHRCLSPLDVLSHDRDPRIKRETTTFMAGRVQTLHVRVHHSSRDSPDPLPQQIRPPQIRHIGWRSGRRWLHPQNRRASVVVLRPPCPSDDAPELDPYLEQKATPAARPRSRRSNAKTHLPFEDSAPRDAVDLRTAGRAALQPRAIMRTK